MADGFQPPWDRSETFRKVLDNHALKALNATSEKAPTNGKLRKQGTPTIGPQIVALISETPPKWHKGSLNSLHAAPPQEDRSVASLRWKATCSSPGGDRGTPDGCSTCDEQSPLGPPLCTSWQQETRMAGCILGRAQEIMALRLLQEAVEEG